MLKVVLIDDEKLAIDVLMDLLAEHATLEVTAYYTNSIEAIEQCPLQDIDVVFMDIEMPGLNGIETASQLLAQNDRLQIVFVSAYMNYLTEVRHIRHTDFLFKPVGRRQMAKTVKKISLGK